jgi:HAD superfamily hydrolase (TIGR01509 family)
VEIHAVVFDCDGVLADSEPAWADAERALCLEYGIDRDAPPWVSTQGKSLGDSVRLLMPHLLDDELDLAVRRFIDIAAVAVPADVRPLPGAVEIVSRLSGTMPVAVASNQPRHILGPVLANIGVAPFITAFVGVDDVARPKPAPDLYLRACEVLGVEGRHVLVFEDSSTGIRAAQAAGCTAIQVGVPGVERFAFADGFVASLDVPSPWLP